MDGPRPISDIVGARIKALRTGRGWSARRLADECNQAGLKMTAAMIENIEGQQRPTQAGRQRRAITVDELIAMAYVLNVPPLVLLLPPEDGGPYPVTPNAGADLHRVFDWLFGTAVRPGAESADPLRDAERAWLTFRQLVEWAPYTPTDNPLMRKVWSAQAAAALEQLAGDQTGRETAFMAEGIDRLLMVAIESRLADRKEREGEER